MEAAATVPSSSSPSSLVSLRPGGGRPALSFRPFASSLLVSDDVTSVSSNNKGGRSLGGGSKGGAASYFVDAPGGGVHHRKGVHTHTTSRERIRYTRDWLLQLQDLWTQAPDELNEFSFDGLLSTGGSGGVVLPEDDWTMRRDVRGLPPVGEPAAAAEFDSRDWRARNPPPPQPAALQQQQQEDRASREQQWDKTPNKQRNDRNPRNERDRTNDDNSRVSREQANSQASSTPQPQQQQQQQQENQNQKRFAVKSAEFASLLGCGQQQQLRFLASTEIASNASGKDRGFLRVLKAEIEHEDDAYDPPRVRRILLSLSPCLC
jgi:hypothetical protein